jgi:hypothetical protein
MFDKVERTRRKGVVAESYDYSRADWYGVGSAHWSFRTPVDHDWGLVSCSLFHWIQVNGQVQWRRVGHDHCLPYHHHPLTCHNIKIHLSSAVGTPLNNYCAQLYLLRVTLIFVMFQSWWNNIKYWFLFEANLKGRKVSSSRSDELNEFFSVYVLLAALGPGTYSAPNRNEYKKQKNNVSVE